MRRAFFCRSLIGCLISLSANGVQANEAVEKVGSISRTCATGKTETSKLPQFPVIHIRESPYLPPSFGWTVGQPRNHVTEFINGCRVFSLGKLPDPPAYAERNARDGVEMLLKSVDKNPHSTLHSDVLQDYLNGKPGFYSGACDAETNF